MNDINATSPLRTAVLGVQMLFVTFGALVCIKADLSEPRNLIIIAMVLVFGVGGMQFSIGEFTLKGIGLSAITAILLNILLPRTPTRLHLSIWFSGWCGCLRQHFLQTR